ncbi:MAG TPA: tol-pal system protein YbgF [Rhizomicrobium sp.]|nr:tol-pal system protein YbgF [Rhizomicrobium sp.]
MRTNKSRNSRLWPFAVVAVASLMMGAVSATADVGGGVVHQLTREQIEQRADTARIFIAQQDQMQDRHDGLMRVADLFGESDDEKAAREQKEQSQDAAISQLSQRVNDLQDSLTRLTGANEALQHKIGDLNAKIDRMQHDFDYRLCTLASQQLGASGGDALPCDQQAAQAPQPQSGQQLAPPPGVLGQIPSNTPLPLAPPPSAVAPAAPEGAATSQFRPQFDAAMTLLSKAQYDQSRAAFRAFADQHPKDDLAPQAVYWVGDIAYVQKDYQNAARAFVEELKNYGSSGRAPDSMLKLGQSLIALNQKAEGCTTLGALPSKYPQASKTVFTQAKAVRAAAHCK